MSPFRIEVLYVQVATKSELSERDWILNPNLLNEDSVASHIYSYTNILLSTDIWRNFYVYWHMVALYNILTNEGALLCSDYKVT